MAEGPFYPTTITVGNLAASLPWLSDDEATADTIRNLIAENTIAKGDLVRVENLEAEIGDVDMVVAGIDAQNIWCRVPSQLGDGHVYYTIDASVVPVTLVEKAER